MVQPKFLEKAWDWVSETPEDRKKKILIGLYITPRLLRAMDRRWRKDLSIRSRSEYLLRLVVRDLMSESAKAGEGP